MTRKYKVHYSEIQGDVLLMAHGTNTSCSKDKKVLIGMNLVSANKAASEPSFEFSNIPEWIQSNKKDQKIKLQYSEVRGMF